MRIGRVEGLETDPIQKHDSILPAARPFGYSLAMSQEKFETITLTALDIEAVALSTIRAAIGEARYQYLSGPITGGRRLLEWHEVAGRELAEADYRSAKGAAVVEKNIKEVQLTAKRERDAHRNTIEPGSFEAEFEQWGQEDFLRFWEKVIEQHASHVKLMDGWEFSSGCAYELLCARKHGRPTFDMRGVQLTNEAALELLDNALAQISARHDPANSRDAEIVKLHAKITVSRKKVAALA